MAELINLTENGFALPEPDGDISRLMDDFRAYCDTLVTEEDNASNVYDTWIDRGSELLSGLTPFEYIKRYAGEPPVFERYEKLVLCMLSSGVYSLPDKVLEDFFAVLDDPTAWRRGITEKCLDHVAGEDRELSERCFMLLYKLSEIPGGFDGELYCRFISTAEAMMDGNDEYASDLLTMAALCCENGFERTLDLLAEKNMINETFGPVETKLLAVLCFNGRKDDRLYAMLRTLVKKTDMFNEDLKFYFTLVKDYGDQKAVSFLRTKVNQMRDAYMNMDSGSEKAKILFDNAFYGDGVIRQLGGAGYF